MRPAKDFSDQASVGLVREILQVILGLEPEVEDRVMRLIRGSEDAQDIKTPEMRMRIGARAMKYLTNAIDLARSEGSEYHEEDPDFDLSKERRGDIEPGHHHEDSSDLGDEGEDVREGFTFKTFLMNEVEITVDTDDVSGAIDEIRKKGRMNPVQAATREVLDAQEKLKAAKEMDPSDPKRNMAIRAANEQVKSAMMNKKEAMMNKSQPKTPETPQGEMR